MALLLMTAVWSGTGIFFSTNDDRAIVETLAGTITQTPDPHVKLVNWLLTAPLCLLYEITGEIPWYGLCLLAFHTMSWMAVFYGILFCCQSRLETLAGIGMGCGCFLVNLYSVGMIQFTSTASLMATAGYVCLCLRQDRKGMWAFGCLELFACFLRRDAMLMIQPMGGTVFLCLFWVMGGWKCQDRTRIPARWIGIVTVVFILNVMGNLAGYHGTEWREYDQWNQARIEMFDYYGTPAYEDVKAVLDRYQVTRTEYEAYCNYVMLTEDISPKCAEELAAYARETNNTGTVMEALWQSFSTDIYQDPLSGSRVMVTLWLCLIIWTAATGQLKMLVPLLGLGITRTAVWSYIFYRGRILPRVSYPLIFCESMFLLVIFVKSFTCVQRNGWIRVSALCLICVFLAQGCIAGLTQYRYVKEANQGQAVYIQGLKEIREYCLQYPDRRFFLENFSFSYYKGSVLETDIYKPANVMYTGGWNANTPVLKEYLQTYMGEVWDDFWLITYDDGEAADIQANHAAVRYFHEKSGVTPVMEERIMASHGGSYLVWHFAAGSHDKS